MLFLMFVTFFTSRVVLDKLGVVDFGIQNVVGGMASMFTFFRSSLSNATQRYLSVALGKEDFRGANIIFCQHQTLYFIISIIVFVISEIVGLWFLDNYLVIPTTRHNAAFWVFQFTVISLSFTILNIVYDSVLIAREDMKMYSYLGVVEGILKLIIAYVISIIAFDRLIVYSFLLSILSIGIVLFYAYYCKQKYEEAKYIFFFDRKSFCEVSSFINWNIVGTAVWAINDQGINIMLNTFFGPIVNAARGIAFQVSQGLNLFAMNFFTAIRPQMIKSYAAEDLGYLFNLFYKSSKYSVYLLWYFSLPVILYINVILSIWLKEVPMYTDVFTIWILIFSLVNALNNPIWTIALAIGELKWYIMIGSLVFLLTFPIAYYCLYIGLSPVSVFVVSTIVRAFYVFVVLIVIKHYISFSLISYMSQVIIPVSMVLLISYIVTSYVKGYLPDDIYGLVMFFIVSSIIISIVVWSIGIRNSERRYLKKLVKSK